MALDKTKVEELLKKDLFKELGLENVSYEERMGLLDEMGKVAMDGIWLRLLEHLTEADQAELEKLTDASDDPAAFMGFLKKKIPNLEDVIKEEIASYKSILLGA